jgi:nitrogen-specific signal transduction histidine kinase/ActR/RegA family two-component response regulator
MVAEDVTELRVLETLYRQSQRMDAVGRLAGGIAHDFNNLLTVIIASADLIMDGEGSAGEDGADVEEIRTAADRAAQLTRQLLSFSRQQVSNPDALDLTAVVAEVERMLRRLIGEDIRMATRLEPEGCIVRADRSQLEQILLNLVVNARDAMPRGGDLVIETMTTMLGERDPIAVRGRIEGGEYVVLSVRDTGSGIDPDHLDRIFEPFFSTKDQGKGTGLGLATVYGIVRRHGGHIDVNSEVGRGTRFRVFLPRLDDAPVVPNAVPEIRSLEGAERVLVVEDENGVRRLVRRILESRGYSVITAVNGADAIEVAGREEGPIDLLLTDVVMPGMSGPEVAAYFARRRPSTKVLFFSGYTGDAISRHGVKGADIPLIQKPFSADDLVRAIRGILDSRTSDAA